MTTSAVATWDDKDGKAFQIAEPTTNRLASKELMPLLGQESAIPVLQDVMYDTEQRPLYIVSLSSPLKVLALNYGNPGLRWWCSG